MQADRQTSPEEEDSMTYDRIVAAALAETTSKFKLAEALALDIPSRRPGPDSAQEYTIPEHLEHARLAILAAGGEPRAAQTLSDYRLTALWVSADLSRNFAWLPGVSFSAHNDARAVGLSYEDLVDLPAKTVDAVRRKAGTAGTRGSEQVARNWTPEEKAAAARELMKDPSVADQVAADPVAASHAAAAIDRHTERQRELQRNVRRDDYDHGDWPVNPLNLVWEFRQLHKAIDRIAAEVSKRGAIVGPEERDALIEEVDWLRNALAMVEAGIKGHSLDVALARILAGETS
jgi:hypothetical protein